MEEKTKEEITKEINEFVDKVVGNLNNIDSRKDRGDMALEVLNAVIAGVELSKTEKAGTLVYLIKKRIG